VNIVDNLIDIIDKEIWKDIVGYEGIYQISNLGRVKSLERFILRKTNIYSYIRERILKQNLNNWGYFLVNLYKDKKSKSIKVHRFVGFNFIPNPSNLPQINHIDGIKTNNKVENLEWSNKSMNQIHAYKTKLIKPTKGEKNGKSKLTNNDVINIRKRANDQTRVSLAIEYKVTQQNISAIIYRKIWKHI